MSVSTGWASHPTAGSVLMVRTSGTYLRYMPLPRFDRLPPKRRAEILRVARRHFGRDGRDGASFNQILADARLPKTSAYQYFDSKEDLAGAVLADVNGRLLEALGPWKHAPSARAFWAQLKASHRTLSDHLAAHADDLGCLRALGLGQTGAAELEWFGAVIDNGIALELVRRDTDRALLVATTVGFFRAVDGWVLESLAAGEAPAMKQAWVLLEGLWGASR